MPRTVLIVCTLVFVSAWGVLVARLATAVAPATDLQLLAPDGTAEAYFTCNARRVQIAQRSDRIWTTCEVGDAHWITEIDYARGEGRLRHQVPGPARLILEDPSASRIAFNAGDALIVLDIDKERLEQTSLAGMPRINDLAWKDGKAWAIAGSRQVIAIGAEGSKPVMTLQEPPGRDFSVVGADVVQGEWRLIMIDAPEAGGDARLVSTVDGSTLTPIMPLPAQPDSGGKARWRPPLVLTGATRFDVTYGPLVAWRDGAWQIEPTPTPVDSTWFADRYATADGTRWIARSQESTRLPSYGRVHDRWVYYGMGMGQVGFSADSVTRKVPDRYMTMLRPLADGYTLTVGLGQSFGHLNAELTRTDALSWPGRVGRLYTAQGWAQSGIRKSVFRAIALPWVLLLFPVMALAAARLRRRLFLVVWLIGAGVFATTYWDLVQIM